MPRTVGFGEQFRDQGDDIIGKPHVLGLLGIDAEPAVMRQVRTLWRGAALVLRQLKEVIVKAMLDPCGRSRPRKPVRTPRRSRR